MSEVTNGASREIDNVSVQETYQRMSALVVAGVPHDQIAAVVGLSPQEVAIVLENDHEFKTLHAINMAKRHEQARDLDDGWNKLEELSITGLLTNLEFMQDPDTLIKMATMANRANRRGKVLAPLRAEDARQASFVITERFAAKLEMMATEVKDNVHQRTDDQSGNSDPEILEMVDDSDPRGISGVADKIVGEQNGVNKMVDYLNPAAAGKLFKQGVEVTRQYTIETSGHVE